MTPDQRILPQATIDFSAHSVADYNITTVQTLKSSRGSGIPSLTQAIEAWKEGDENPLYAWGFVMERASVPINALKFLYTHLASNNFPHIFLDHEPLATIPEKESFYTASQQKVAEVLDTQEPIQPIKTVSMKIKDTARSRHVFVTTLGGNIDNDTKRAIAQDLNLSMGPLKSATINPPLTQWDAVMMLGMMMPGIIGPFYEAQSRENFDRWYIVDDPTIDPSTPVEIALSYLDSLVVKKETYEQLLQAYEQFCNAQLYTRIS